MLKTLYCFRHGETDWNKEGKLQGCEVDLSLNETGRKQALDIPHFPIEVIYSSPLKRAFETADIYNQKHNVEIIKHNGIEEVNFGKWTGKTWENARKQYGSDLSKTALLFNFFTVDEQKDISNKFKNTLINIAKKSKFDKIGVFSHGTVLLFINNELSERNVKLSKNSESLQFSYDTETEELKLK